MFLLVRRERTTLCRSLRASWTFKSLASWALQETREGKEILQLNRKQSFQKRNWDPKDRFCDDSSRVQKQTPGERFLEAGTKESSPHFRSGGGGWLTKYMPGFSNQWLDCVQPATPWGWNPLASRLAGGLLRHTGSLWAQLKPWQGLAGPQGCQRRLPRGNIGAVVPNVLLHFKVKMWSTHWTGKWPWHYKCTELKNNNHYNLRTPVPPHFLLFSPRVTYLRRGVGEGGNPNSLLQLITQGRGDK